MGAVIETSNQGPVRSYLSSSTTISGKSIISVATLNDGRSRTVETWERSIQLTVSQSVGLLTACQEILSAPMLPLLYILLLIATPKELSENCLTSIGHTLLSSFQVHNRRVRQDGANASMQDLQSIRSKKYILETTVNEWVSYGNRHIFSVNYNYHPTTFVNFLDANNMANNNYDPRMRKNLFGSSGGKIHWLSRKGNFLLWEELSTDLTSCVVNNVAKHLQPR